MEIAQYREFPPSAAEAMMARNSGQVLAPLAQRRKPLPLRIPENGHEIPFELPAGAVALLMKILEAMAAGQSVTLIPEHAELTTVQAAEILNVSRPFLIKLLESNAIPFRRVGKHRRIRMEDVMAYKENIDRERESVLDELAREGQILGLGYE
jgi:excisionase family DNA binding protein